MTLRDRAPWLLLPPIFIGAGLLVGVAGSAFPPRVVAISLIGATVLAAIVAYATRRGAQPLTAAAFAMQVPAVLFVTFNGVEITKHLKPADPFLVAAAVLLVLSALAEGRLPVPRWLVVGAFTLVAGGLISVTFEGGAGSLGRLLIAAILTPLVVGSCRNRVLFTTLVEVWLLGTLANGLVALSDAYRHTHYGTRATGLQFFGRQGGLTVQPNHLALACVLALSVALSMALGARGRQRARFLAYVAVYAGAILVSGSRAGVLAALVAMLLVYARTATIKRTVAMACAMVALVLVAPSLHVAAINRLTGRAPVSVSDQTRVAAYHDAVASFQAHPLTGSGLADAQISHDIYLQLLGSGGLIVFAGFAILMLGALRMGLRLNDRVSVGAFTAFGAWLAFGLVQNQLDDRFIWIPLGLLIAANASHGSLRPADPVLAAGSRPGRTGEDSAAERGRGLNDALA